jgi:hypothetical protein
VSCNRNSSKVGATAGVAAGITRTNGRLGYNLGQIMASTPNLLNRAGEAAGSVADYALQVVEPTDPDARQTAQALSRTVGGMVNIAAWVTGVRPALATGKRVVSIAGRVTGMAGNLAAALCKSGNAGTVEVKKRFLLFFTSKQKVQLSKSRLLTSFLNRSDVLPGAEVVNTTGALFKAGGNTWHWGETTVHTSRGQHTVTHLQALALPSDHYYFDRQVSAYDMVELASGSKKPESIEGFAGTVSQTEMLCPGWALTNQALILSKIHWPPLQAEVYP